MAPVGTSLCQAPTRALSSGCSTDAKSALVVLLRRFFVTSPRGASFVVGAFDTTILFAHTMGASEFVRSRVFDRASGTPFRERIDTTRLGPVQDSLDYSNLGRTSKRNHYITSAAGRLAALPILALALLGAVGYTTTPSAFHRLTLCPASGALRRVFYGATVNAGAYGCLGGGVQW